ncbi:MAG: primase, partial [Acidimicrobiaceae bacterium]|nr:primase [Acidimicrobiaceae bacterium]
RPDEVSAVLDQVAGGNDLDAVARILLIDDLHLAAFQALAAAQTLHEAFEAADPGAAELLRRLAVEDTDADPEDVVGLLVRTAATRVLRDIDAESRSSTDPPVRLAPSFAWLKLAMEELGEPKTRIPAASRLVPWLLGQVEEDA